MNTKATILSILLLGSIGQDTPAEEPIITPHQGVVYDFTRKDSSNSEVATFDASGGDTSPPPDNRGCPPWSKTGVKKYTWSIEVRDGENPDSNVESANETLTINFTKTFAVSVFVKLQEEYVDSAEEPTYLLWPELE